MKINKAFIILLLSTIATAQNLTISSSGETGTTGTNWSISSNVLTVSGTANIAVSVIENHLASNSLSIQGNSNSFAVNLSQAITSTASGNGLTIGATNNTGNISLNNAINLAGSMTIFGGRVSIMEAFSLSSTNNLSITSINTVIAGTTTIGGYATINASSTFILGTNITAGTGFPLTATGGFTKTGAGTSYLFSNINTTNTAVTIAGPVVVGNFNTSNTITQINSNGGNISIPGAVSAYSGTGRDYMALVYANLYDAVGGSVTGSTTDIYLRFNAGNQSYIGLPGMPASFNMQYLLVAAGGAGGGSNIGVWSGGGGGGGGVADGSITYTSGTPLNLVIGAGGIGVPGSGNINGLNGGDTGISDLGLWVGGGGGGGGSDGYNGKVGTGNNNVALLGRSYLAGGGGGGSGRGNGTWISGGTGTQYSTSGQGTGTSYGGWFSWGGGGGGATGNGTNLGDLYYGGSGRSSSITGIPVEYGAGSGSRDRTSTIGSGGRTNTSDAVAVNGSNGALILRFALSSSLDAAVLSTAFHLNAVAGSVTLGSTVANLSTIEITAGIASTITGPVTGTGSLLKTGTGTLTLLGDNRYSGGTTVTTGTLVLNDTAPMDGMGVIVGTLNINQNGTVQLTGLASALGYNANRVTTININGGILESSTGQQHIWNLTGGLNFNGGGTLRTNGGTSNAAATSYFEWGVSNITVTNPTSPAEIAGRINLRSDTVAVLFTIADGVAENDLLISAAITQSSAPTITKTGAGKLTFTGTNSYTGTTTISEGSLQIGNGSTSGTISSGAVTNNAALVFNRSDDYTISNVISGTGTVTKTGAGALTLSGANTYTGLTTISQGTLKCGSTTALGTIAGSTTIATGTALDLNGVTLGSAEPITINGTGISASGAIFNSTTTAVTLSSPITLASNATINGKDANIILSGTINGAFALNVNTTNKTYTQSGIIGGTTPLSAYTVNVGTSQATFSGATTAAGPVSITGATLAVNANLTAASNNVTLTAATAVTQTAPITANGLDLYGAGTFTLTNTSNNIATLAGGSALSKLGSVNYMDSDGFSIGTVTNIGITTTGTITAETQLGNITIAQNITTDNTTTSAITINAGKSKSIGDATGGNVIISGSPLITTGANGITKLFSGREAESTGLSAFVGASNVRLGVDETTVTFAPVLANNTKYALYRFNDATIGSITIVSSGGVTLNNGWEFVNNTIIPTSAAAININASVLQDYLLTNPLTVRAGSITFSTNITNSTANQLTLNSNTFIRNTTATTITTTGGNVLMASNVDDATDNDTTTNGYIQFSSGLTMTTNGGNITLGGGDAAASGYALGNNVSGSYEGIRVDGTLNLNSGGGNIIMRGKSYAVNSTAARWALGFWALTTGTINSGTGTILLDGFSQSSVSTYSSALYNNGALTITSANTTVNAIQMIGKSTGTSGDAWGIEANSALSVLATGDGGGITISSSQQNSANNYDAVFRGETNILAKSGPIQLLGKQDGGIANGKWYTGGNFYIGSKASSVVPISSSNITIQYDKFDFPATKYIATSGNVNFQPASASFGEIVYSSWFNWNQNSQTMSGLTIGKSGNTANVTHQTNAISVAGPTTIYGGNIVVNQNFTSTLSGADMLLQASGYIALGANYKIETNTGDINFKSNSNGTATTVSAITLNSGASLVSQGGNITLGGNFDGTQGTGLYSVTNNAPAILLDGPTITAAGGNIALYGKCSISYDDGIRVRGSITTTGSGTIGLYGEAFGGNNGTDYFGGITFGSSSGSTIETENGNIILNGFLTNTQSNTTGAINFYRNDGSTGQTRHINLLSKTGNINITADIGSTSAYGIGHSSWGNVYVGSPISGWTATGNIVFNYARLVNAGFNGFKVKTTGAVTYEPNGSNFTAAQTFPASSNYILAESASSLTIGKAGNTSNLTMGSAQTVAGPISIYAGTITLNADLTATNNGAISLYSDNAIGGLSAQRNVTAAGFLNYIPQSDSFAAAVTYPITNLNVSGTGLLIGKETNTSNITFGSATTINGPITAFGGAIALNANLTTSNTTTGAILLKGTTVSGLGNLALAAGRTATINISSASTYDGIISGVGSGLTKTGAGLLTLTKDHTYTGATTITGGDLQVGTGGSVSQASSGTVSTTSGVAVASGSKFILSPNENIVFAAPISGAGGVEIKGASGAYYNAFLTGTASTIATNSSVLEVLTRITGGLMDGQQVANGATQVTGAYVKSYDAASNTASLQFQQYDGSYTKCVFAVLSQSGSNVQIRANTSIYNGASYRTGNHLGVNMATGSTGIGALATTPTAAGYGISRVYLSGKVNFTGALSYSGNTTLSNTVTSVTSPNTYSYTSKGTQEITDASSSFPDASNVINNGLVIFNRATPLTIASDMEGTEEVLQVGADITLTGTNTHSGNTTIDLNKKLIIGSGSTTGSITGNIINYGTLNFNRSTALTYPGIISGSGALVKSGSNELTLTNLNTYSGTSTIDDGKLILQRDVPATSSGSYSGLGTLVIQPSSNSFTSAVSYPIPGFSVSSSIGGLTLGKPTNTAAITFANATTIAGPITAYGGKITANANLVTTNSSNAPILLQGNKVFQNQGVSVQTNGSNITYNVTNSPWTTESDQGISLGTATGPTATINAQGGNVSIASSFASTGVTNTGGNPDVAILMRNSQIKTSGSGTVTLNGNGYDNASTNGDFIWGTMLHTNEVIQTEHGAISITGTGGKINGNARGIIADNTALKVLSASGPITFTEVMPNGHSDANHSGTYFKPSATNAIQIGADGSLVTNSTSNVVFDVARITFDGTIASTLVKTSGTVTIQPVGNQFDNAVSLAGLSLSNTATGFTIGKSTNTSNVIFGSNTTVAGPITAYGGTITLNTNLTTTNNGAISLHTDNPLDGLSTARTLTAAGAFKYIPRTTTFSADVTYPISNLTATSTGLTIGNITNDKDITISQDVIGGAGIELYGNNLNINANLKTTSSADMYLKGITTIAADKYIESNGNFTHDGNMTFKSTATGTAAFGKLGGTFTTVSGTATVERYIPARRAFRLLSPSVTTSSTIRENWQESGSIGAGLGTHITGSGGTTNGFDITASNNPSLFTYNQTSNTWQAVTNTNSNTLSAGTAYRLMVRGDRTTNLTTNTPTATPTVLRATGALKTGDFNPTLNQTANGYSFVGNPYQAPIDIKAVLTASTNMNTDVVYYWDPTLNDRGAYVTRTLGSDNNSIASDFNQYLQPGQAVFVKKDNTANVPIMTITENDKSIVNATAGVFRNASSNEIGLLRANLKASVNNQWKTIEGALALFHSNYSWGATQEDANKLSNLDEEVSFVQNNTSLAIAMQSNPALTDELPMKLNTTRYTNYKWQFELTNYDGLTPYLFDAQNNTFTQIENNTMVPFTVNGQEQTRFKIVFQNGTLSTPEFSNQMVLYPNPGKSDSGFYLMGQTNAKVSLYNLIGQKLPVETSVVGSNTHVKPSVGLSQGVYLVNITQDGKTAQVKWIVE